MRSLVIFERCVVDPTRPCGACSAPGPGQCPYRYLLDAGELAEIRELTGDTSSRDGQAADAEDVAGGGDRALVRRCDVA
jgi:hypothetical protein